MTAHYGPALLLGVLIGGAILLDDVITPKHKGPPPRVAMIHHGEAGIDPKALGADKEHNVWVIKTDDGRANEINKKVEIHPETEDADPLQQEELTISVRIDANDEPAGDLAAAIGAVIDAARAEGRQPTPEEVEAAVSAVAGDAKSIDVEVLSDSK